MIELALKARLPLIGVVTDDLLNYRVVLQRLTSRTLASSMPKTVNLLPAGDKVYVTESQEYVTAEWLRRLTDTGNTLVVINAKASPLLFDAGVLPTPVTLLSEILDELCGKGVDVEPFIQPLKGLSLTAVSQVVALTQARTGALTVPEIRRTRGMINASIQGLASIDTAYDFYELPEHLKTWLDLNRKYFMEPTHQKLIPRGLLFEGPPGVGKSMGAKAIANTFGCPLYRMDIATVLDRFVGQSEARVARILTMCEREAPCVLLIDEVEKLFGDEGEAGVTTRILSQLLWWLSEHRSRVFTVMTTNDASKIPSELYRQGRMDAKMYLSRMGLQSAITFAIRVLSSTLTKKPTLKQTQHLSQVLKDRMQDQFAHAEVTEMVYHEIKAQHWL